MDNESTDTLSSLPPSEPVADITEGAGLRELDREQLEGAGSGGGGAVGKWDKVLYQAALFMIPTGLIMIILGWVGTAQTVFVFEQIPYLVSGGILGAAFFVGGALIYVAVWIERVAHQQRHQAEQMAELLALLRSDVQTLTTTTAAAAKANGNGGAARPQSSSGSSAESSSESPSGADRTAEKATKKASKRTAKKAAAKKASRKKSTRSS